MKLKNLLDEDIVNYKKTSMFLIFPFCTFKCGAEYCQNSALANEPVIDIPVEFIVKRYINNPITHAIVCGGLEPFDSLEELLELIAALRKYTNDDIIIYTGYTEDEVQEFPLYNKLLHYRNIIIKFGRFVPNQSMHFDELLGVKLTSPNQYGKKVS